MVKLDGSRVAERLCYNLIEFPISRDTRGWSKRSKQSAVRIQLVLKRFSGVLLSLSCVAPDLAPQQLSGDKFEA